MRQFGISGLRFLGAVLTSLVLASCSSATFQPVATSGGSQPNGVHRASVSKYVYVTDRTQEELLVYPAHVPNPSPIRTITAGLHIVGGVAVDASGDVYVANASNTGSPNVVEYSPGATSVIQTFSQGLHYPINVTVDSNGTVYVADNVINGTSTIVEYAPTGGAPIKTIPSPADYPRGLAVDSLGNLFVSINGGDPAAWPPGGWNCTIVYAVYEIPAGGIAPKRLSFAPAWGLALDPAANLYAAQICPSQVGYTSPPSYSWPLTDVGGTFSCPLFATISNDQLLAVPSASSNGDSGYVNVIPLTSILEPVTITNGLEGPIGAAAGPSAGGDAHSRTLDALSSLSVVERVKTLERPMKAGAPHGDPCAG